MLIAIASLLAVPSMPASASVRTLADHIRAANTNTAVGFCPAGTSHDVITITEDITLDEALPPITGKITIEGGGHSISGDGKFSIFKVDGGRLTINNLTLTDGKSEQGGAIEVRNYGLVTVNDSAFLRNRAAEGGAIYTYWPGTELTINRSRFVNNRSTYEGGAIGVQEGKEIRITNSTFVGNDARQGGAIGGGHVPIALTRVTMVNNRGADGRAMYWYESQKNTGSSAQ